MKKLTLYFLLLLAIPASLLAQVTVSGSNGKDGNYTSLTIASTGAFAAINSATHTGYNIVITITASSTSETGAVGLNAGAWTTLTIYPTSTGLTIRGTVAGPLINLNGADYVTIDGRVGGTGSTKDLIITNPSIDVNASTIRFQNSAENNTVKYCTIKGSGTHPSRGIILFISSTTSNGNSGNTIDNNDITSDAAGRPYNAIYSQGANSFENSGNTISYNNIYDFLRSGSSSNGINLSSYTTAWTISGNSFYETTSFVPTANIEYNAIKISNPSGTGFIISENYIGGSSASCSGTWTKTSNNRNNIFYAIYLNVGTGTASSVQNNTIKNFAWSNSLSAAWTGIHIAAGEVNIGTSTGGNTIGAATGTGSITVTGGTSTTIVYGINIASEGTVDCQNNTIGSVTTANIAANASDFYGINITGSGTTNISNNTIGSTTTANSIYASSVSSSNPQSIYGISNAGTGDVTIRGNTIANLTNGTTYSASNLYGLYFSGGTGANVVRENFIHSLSVNASSTTASVFGINIDAGTSTYSNNIISLGGNTTTTIYGIFEQGYFGNDNNLYFNTVYIGGSPGSGTNKSYALYSFGNNNTRDFRNNIFVNARSTTGGSNLHYAAFFNYGGSANLTLGYNDYYAPGTGGVLGYYAGANVTTLPFINGQDIGSWAIDPGFSSPGGTTPASYLPTAASLVAVTGTGITTDYTGTTRSTTYPSMGAYEYTVSLPTWTGSTSTDWNTASNWSNNAVPTALVNVTIPDVATNDPVVNQDLSNPASTNNLTIESDAQLTITAAKALKVSGTLTNNAGTAGLVIKSAANGNDGKLFNNSSSVDGTVELYLSGGIVTDGRIYHYFVPPVLSMIIGVNTPYPTVAEAKTSFGLTNFVGDLVAFDETHPATSNKEEGWQFFDGWNSTTGFSSLLSTKGYNIHLTAGDKITFNGQLNGAAHSFSLTYTGTNISPGWNLVGNPYPCNYDLSGITELTSTDDVDNTVYFNYEGGYKYWNVETGAGSSGYSDIVPPMQGFFVHVNAASTLNLPVGSKTTLTSSPMRSKGVDGIKKVKLVLNGDTLSDETIVCLIDKATTGFDGDYDAYKLFGGGNATPFIYSELNSVKYAINSVQSPESELVKIPVTLVLKSQGTYKIDITEFENLEGLKVVLKHGAIETILSKNTSYAFTSNAGTFTDFELIIGNNNTPTGVDNLTNEKLKTWYSNDYLYINCPGEISSDKGSLIIYDIQGKMVYNNNLIYITPGQTIQLPLTLPKGVYVTHVISNDKTLVSKIVVF